VEKLGDDEIKEFAARMKNPVELKQG
jgi:hypothetical protein